MRLMAYGDGTLLQRRSGPRAGEWTKRYKSADGRWHATSWPPGPKPTRAMVTARLDAIAARSSSSASRESAGETLGAFLDRWLRDGTAHLRERTVRGYSVLATGSIGPRLGSVHLSELDTPTIQRAINTGLSHHALAVLRAALSEAVRWGLISTNPARGVRLPKREQKERAVLTPEQTKVLLEHVKGDPLEALFVLSIYTGMRQGEALGLRWEDLDLKGGTLTVNHSLWWRPLSASTTGTIGAAGSRASGAASTRRRRPVLTEPKTPRSRRRITLPAPVVEKLQEHQRTQRFTSKDNLVFTAPDGTALDPFTVFHSLRRHLRSAGLPIVTWHSLRHSAATNLLAAGVPVGVVSDLLGHSTVTTTLSVYRHAVERTQSVAADAMTELLRDEAG